MAHFGWIFPVIVYLGGILTGLYGHVGKYSLDKANELKELIVQIRLSISSFEYHPSQAKALSNYASPLRSKLELIRCYGYVSRDHVMQDSSVYQAKQTMEQYQRSGFLPNRL
jgi:hypothetical protein